MHGRRFYSEKCENQEKGFFKKNNIEKESMIFGFFQKKTKRFFEEDQKEDW